ncbi:ATP-grasp domain-containing protein [Halovibrio salipaludis]|uniref:ATP-grasp domain-containing protein n=1 Tax=Halovibrio salipaludis TaxID=2032626 RepID=UPI00117B617B|nr:ATP-grasp domain-containing protein [Halovibrio salipaludis]
MRVSRYVTGVMDARSLDNDALVELINNFTAGFSRKPVLFPAGDFDVDRMAELWGRISDGLIATIPPVQASELAGKDHQLEWVRRCGVPLPASETVKDSGQLADALTRLRLPVIARPLDHIQRGNFPGKVFVAQSFEQLNSVLTPVLARGKTRILLQEYIPGNATSVWFALADCAPDGSVRQIITGHKCVDGPEGRTNIGRTAVEPNVEARARKVFECFGVGGVLGVEFKKDLRNGELYYIETNFRPDNFVAISEAAGVNLIFAAYLHAIGHPELYQPQQQKDVVWRDWSLLLRRRIRGRPWYRGSNGKPLPVVDAFWASDDKWASLMYYAIKFWEQITGRT